LSDYIECQNVAKGHEVNQEYYQFHCLACSPDEWRWR